MATGAGSAIRMRGFVKRLGHSEDLYSLANVTAHTFMESVTDTGPRERDLSLTRAIRVRDR